MHTISKLPVLVAAALAALFLGGCGGDERPEGSSQSQSEAPRTAEPPAGEVREIVIEANDQMKFNVESFAVKPGESIRLVLKNVGSMPKFSMGHNVVVLKKGEDPAAFAESATMAAANDYIPPGGEDKIIAHTALLGGGEEDSVTFTAPKDKGEYPFLCTFPGHFQLGMGGVMTVQ